VRLFSRTLPEPGNTTLLDNCTRAPICIASYIRYPPERGEYNTGLQALFLLRRQSCLYLSLPNSIPAFGAGTGQP
jgi:hypothetical protein